MNPISAKIDTSVAAEVRKGEKVISPGNKTSRLIFHAPNSRTDFNIAIAEDPKKLGFMKDKLWAKIHVSVDGQEKDVFVNVNSLSKRLGLSKEEIYNSVKTNQLESLVSQRLESKINSMGKPAVSEAIKAPPLKLGSFIERVKGALADAWWSLTTGTFDLFRFRFLIGATDEQLQEEGQRRAMTSYHNAYEKVPAYKKYIDDKGVMPKTFAEIPETGKKEYIQTAAKRNDLFLDGKLPKKGQSDSTSGTTGTPVMWTRSKEEIAMTRKLMEYARKASGEGKNVCIINTFALGPWATGVTIAGAGSDQGLIFNPGTTPDFVSQTIAYIKEMPDDREIVLFGYPPNVRKIGEAIKNDPVLSSKQLKLKAIVGGEGMSEDLRSDIIKCGFSKVYSSYGASDLDINIGNETDTEIAVRKACLENPALAEELYGGGPPPMIFRYDPLHYYIETSKDGELIFTACRKEKASPRVRYNLHDSGKTMMAKDVVATLKKYGVEIQPKTNLPFLFVHGREGAVSFGGAKVQFDHLDQALRNYDKDKLVKNDRFALHKPDDDHLELWLEASSDEAYADLVKNIENWKTDLVEAIKNLNVDFKDSLKASGKPPPKLRVFKPGESPMSMHVKEKPQSKLQRVVPASPTLANHLQEHPETYVLSS